VATGPFIRRNEHDRSHPSSLLALQQREGVVSNTDQGYWAIQLNTPTPPICRWDVCAWREKSSELPDCVQTTHDLRRQAVWSGDPWSL